MVDISDLLGKIPLVSAMEFRLLFCQSKYLKNFVVPLLNSNGMFISNGSGRLVLGYIDQKLYSSYVDCDSIYVIPSKFRTPHTKYNCFGFLKYGQQVNISGSSIEIVDEGDENCVDIIWKPTVWLKDRYIEISLVFVVKRDELEKFMKHSETHNACEDCGSSNCKTWENEEGKLYVMCSLCIEMVEVVSTCKLCKIGCLYDDSLRHGLCKKCYEICVNSDQIRSLAVARIGEEKDEYDALVIMVNRALQLPDKEGTFATFGKCDNNAFSIFANKMNAHDLWAVSPKILMCTNNFYKKIERYAFQTYFHTKYPCVAEIYKTADDDNEKYTRPAKKQKSMDLSDDNIGMAAK